VGGVGRVVIAYLRGIFPRTATPKEIAAACKVSHEAVKKVLTRNPEYVTQVRRGEYRAFLDGALMRGLHTPECEVHNLVVVAPLSLSARGALPAAGRGLQAEERVSWWRGRRVTISIEAGERKQVPKVVVYLAASEKPLKVPEFVEYVEHLGGILAAAGAVHDGPDVKVRRLEVNADYPLPKVALAGAEVMTLSGFKGGLLKAYNKRKLGVLRLEACLWPVDARPEEIIRVFAELTRPKLAETKDGETK